MGYLSRREDDAFRQGKMDAEYRRLNYGYDMPFGSDVDKAYYDGVKEQEKEEERRKEMYDEMRREEEKQIRKQEEHRRYIRDMEGQEDYREQYDRQQEDDMQQDQKKWYHNSDGFPF